MKIVFCTFANSGMKKSLARIKRQAEKSYFYDDIYCWNESDLPANFVGRNSDILIPGVRGFGYWSWKPEMLRSILEKINEGDIIHYADAGCWINKNGEKRFNEYLSEVIKSEVGILAFQVLRNDIKNLEWFSLPEYKWTKGDLFDYFHVREDKSITHTEQIVATTFFIKKNSNSIDFVNKWASVVDSGRYLIDDSPSSAPNFEGFSEHRHDQSVFSLLAKIYRVPTISYFECFYPSVKDTKRLNVTNCMADWVALRNSPILAKRDKNFGLTNKIYRGLKKIKKILWGET